MPTPRLLHPLRLRIARIPYGEIEQDNTWRVPEGSMVDEEILERSPKFLINAQMTLSSFDDLSPTMTGSQNWTAGTFVITAKTQRVHKIRSNDFIIGILQKGGVELKVLLRIISARPAAQRESFGLYKIEFRQVDR